MLRIPVQIFAGYSGPPRRQARRKGWAGRALGTRGGERRVWLVEGALLFQIEKGLLKVLSTTPRTQRRGCK